MTEKNSSLQNFFRITVLTVVLLGAVGSLIFMFQAGRNQKSFILIALFTAWVSFPFAGLFIVYVMYNSWRIIKRASLYGLMIGIAIGSLVAYSGVLIPPETKPAFIFLVVPPISWLLIGILFLVGKRMSRKSVDTDQN